MLDSDTKHRIDSCRDILVGKVPDPKSQVEQITIALIYKFMDDMDAEAEELGGKRSFFAGDYAKYGWAKLMAPHMGGFDVLALYSEAIQKMNENPGIPGLFRDIFKNAYLPYRDPETLRIFLKEIDGFTYDHSERLGDAFEYLLSVLGSQGDAGQFRTPRHIIDFMVEIIDPKKDETILDPACGTAGFLISSYKHILKHNSKGYRPKKDREAYDEKGVPIEALTLDSPLHYKGDLLTPDERKRVAANIKGYDISPDMVRLSLVNLYLHGFINPHIDEYDTLTSEERWNDYADVILANPPFMSPKGGIKPHKRFSVQAKRSEVLFVDYIAEHLTPNGRAAVIVPEGIIFQSGTAYKQLREMLIKNALVAVISLPAGMFNPYSGVKTSILVLDKRLAKKTHMVLFGKIENDGFNLGAQRRAIDGSDLPEVVQQIKAWLASLRDGGNFDTTPNPNLHLVEKGRIGENGEWNLSGERYRSDEQVVNAYDMVELGNVEFFQIESGGTPKSTEEAYWDGDIYWATLVDLPPNDFITNITRTARTISKDGLANSSAKIMPIGSVIVSSRATIGRVGIARVPLATNQGFKNIVIRNSSRALPEFIAYMMKRLAPRMEAMATGGTFKEISKTTICTLKIPLPPLEVQKKIVAEIEGYQKVIDGARQVVANYQPCISIHPDWPEMELGEVCRFIDYRGKTPKKTTSGIPLITAKNVREGFIDPEPREYIAEPDYDSWMTRGIPQVGDVLFTTEAPLGYAAQITSTDRFALAQRLIALCPNRELLIGGFLKVVLLSKRMREIIVARQSGTTVYGIKASVLKEIKIPVPPLATQQAIVAEIEAEQALVNANKELIRLFEAKIKTTINRVWGEAGYPFNV